ncbi:hypothetical protein [Caldilinea aerophila]|jgi:hypothetical protein|uniref:Glycosyltransferase RgtA/B/C/D-like domain-containing protein n=1 Tax=Caldilinea aerophila (strain DSM 14535 / JCM 11387 / NBRC 104270 / STL-6-O1) TaxID=926550 RepID=I0I6D5_CALAS|nr:hypothetical protein [Caldilinea aerophila]BAM00823.1 hypothetical protein CLDAP_27830 [Caldilinea aerophila DSM 14535 = NBRC 104270]
MKRLLSERDQRLEPALGMEPLSSDNWVRGDTILRNASFSLERLHALAIAALVLLCSVYFFPRWADPNQNSRLDMIFAVVEDGTFQIDKYAANTVDYAKVGEHYYSDKAPGAAFLGIPLYAGLRPLLETPLIEALTKRLESHAAFASTLRAEGSGVSAQKVRFAIVQVYVSFFVSALPTAALAALLFLWLRVVTPQAWLRAVIALGYGLATPAFAYANAFYGHQLAAFLLFLAFYLLTRAPARIGAMRALLVGLVLGYAFITEYPVALMVAPIGLYGLYLFWKRRQPMLWLWFIAGGAAVAAGWMAYNTVIFGGPLELGYSRSELWTEQHHTGFMSLTAPTLDAVWGVTFSPFRGLFLLSPWLLWALPGFVLWWRNRTLAVEWWVTLVVVVSMFLFNFSSSMWWGGFAVGPRYLLPMLPFLTLPIAFVLVAWGERLWLRTSMALSLLWSFMAVWSMTLAEQAFPSDTLRNPWVEHVLPNWVAGNIARNVGTVLGLEGVWSLAPLLVMLVLGTVAWRWLAMRRHAPLARFGEGGQPLIEIETEKSS